MAVTATKLLVEVGADVKDALTGLDKVGKEIDGNSAHWGKIAEAAPKSMMVAGGAATQLGRNLTDVGKKMTMGLTLPIAAIGAVAFNAASDLSESISKVNVVFGDSAKKIQDWSKTTAESLGIPRQGALEAAGTFGNLFSAMNIGTPAAADMSKNMVILAGDLASFNNANPQEVLDALRSGLTGETEPLKRFGVNINQARLEAEAFALGLVQPVKNAPQITAATLSVEEATRNLAKTQKEHGKESLEAREAASKLELAQQKLADVTAGSVPPLDAAQKAQASYSLIMKDTTLAQGDFERTADGAANKQRILTSQFKDAGATMGTQLLPIGQKVLGFVSGLLSGFQSLSGPTQTFILGTLGVAAALGPVITVVGNVTKAVGFLQGETVATAAKTVIAWGQKAAAAVAAAATHVAQVAIMIGHWILLGVQSLLHAAKVAAAWLIAIGPIALVIAAVVGLVILIIKNWETIKEVTVAVFSAIGRFLEGIWNRIKAFLEGIWNGIKAAAEFVFNLIKAYFEFVFNLYKTIITAVWEAISGFLTGIWNGIKAVAETVWNAIKDFFITIFTFYRGLIEGIWNGIKDFLTGIWNGIKGVATTVWNAIKDFFITIFTFYRDLIEGIWNGIRDFIVGLWNGIKDRAVAVWDALRDFFGNLLNNIKWIFETIWNGIGDFLRGIFDTIKGVFVGAWNAIRDTVANIWDGIKNAVWGGVIWVRDTIWSVLESIKGIWGRAWEWLSEKASGIWEGIKGAVKAGINGLIGILNGLINGIEKGLNAIIRAFNKIPGIPKIPSVDIPNIPTLAAGGEILRAGLAVVGERGPELLSLPRGAEVAPLRPAATGADGRTLLILIELDGRTIGRAVAPVMVDEIRVRTGVKL